MQIARTLSEQHQQSVAATAAAAAPSAAPRVASAPAPYPGAPPGAVVHTAPPSTALLASAPSSGGGSSSHATASLDISKEVVINDAPTHVRALLTKQATASELMRRSHTAIVTRGRYIPGGAARGSATDRPLYLRVTPTASAGQVGAACWTLLGGHMCASRGVCALYARGCLSFHHGTLWL